MTIISTATFINLIEISAQTLQNQDPHVESSVQFIAGLIGNRATESQVMTALLELKERMTFFVHDFRIEVVTPNCHVVCGWQSNTGSASCYYNCRPFVI